MVVMVANWQMGVLSFEKSGFFLTNFPSNRSCIHGSAISQKPIFRIASVPMVLEKNRFFDARTPKCGIINALPNGEVEAYSTNSVNLEKEFKFKPAFDDYLKVMESVRTDRSKNSSDVDDYSSKKRPTVKDTPGAHKGNERLNRFKRHSQKVRTIDHEKGEHREETDLRRGKLGYRGRQKDSKDVIESAKNIKHVETSGWNLVEGILDKKTEGRRDVRGRGKSQYRGSDSDMKHDMEYNSYRKFTGAGENVNHGHFEERNGGYSRSSSDRWKGPRQNGREVRRMDELQIPNEMKDTTGHGSRRKFINVKTGGSDYDPGVGEFGHYHSSVEVQGKNVQQSGRWVRNYVNNIGGEIGDSKINKSKGKDLHRIKGERKIGEYENSECMLEKESSVRSNVVRKEESAITKTAFESDQIYGTEARKKTYGSEIHKNTWKDESSLRRMDQRKTESNIRNTEMEILERGTDGEEQNLHLESIQRNTTPRDTLVPRRNSFTSLKETHVHSRSNKQVRFHDDDTETGKFGSRTIQMRGRSAINDIQSNKAVVAGRDINDIDFEDRAAFKSFEVFTDVRNRPRVLRMEMEERIQKLAKWLNATDVNSPEWQFSKMMHSAQIKFTDHSILRVVQILGALGNWKRVLQVAEWLQSRERFKSYKSRYIYTTVLDVLGKAKRPMEALNIFYTMRQELSSYPDLAAYHCIAVTLGQAGLMKELFDVVDCMRAAPKKKFNLGPLQKWDPRLEPDLIVYNAVLNACVQQKQWEGAFWVLQQLKQQGIQPTSTTYGLIMEVMLACGKYNLVHEFFRKVDKTSIPSTLNYKVLVNTLWREEKIDEAVLAVEDMERRGIVGSASLYYDLARCLCSAGRCQEALLQIDKICKVAKKPLVVTYTGLIQACLDSGSIENGRYIFNQMHKFCSPNIVTCNIMLKSYLGHGMFEEAKDLFQKLLDGSHCIKSKADLSQKVIPDKFTFNTMMEACITRRNWDDFENAYRQMLDHGYHFDVKRHLRMVMVAFRAGKEQVLETTWEHMVSYGRFPPPPIIKERFCMKLQEEKYVAAISCIDIHHGIEIDDFSEKSWLRLLQGKADCFKKDTIVRLVDELSIHIAENNQPHPIFQNLLNACSEFISYLSTSANITDVRRTLSNNTKLDPQ